MADGADRVWGSLMAAVEETHGNGGQDWAVGGTTGANIAHGGVYAGDYPEGNFADVANIRFHSANGRCVRADLEFNPELVVIDEVAVWAKAVWDGAKSKGFPDADWKY